jgi:putative oxidoreductase
MATTSASIRGLVGAHSRLIFLLDRIPYSAVAVVARLSAACVFFRSGIRNLSDWSRTLALFREVYRMPLIPAHAAAYAVTSIELICAGLVLLGLFTRGSALILFGLVAVVENAVYPGAWPDHLQWSAPLFTLLARGPGLLSLDHLIRWLATMPCPSRNPLSEFLDTSVSK